MHVFNGLLYKPDYDIHALTKLKLNRFVCENRNMCNMIDSLALTLNRGQRWQKKYR